MPEYVAEDGSPLTPAQQAEAAALFSAPAPEDNTPVAKMLDPYKPPQYLGDDDKPLALTPAQKTEYVAEDGSPLTPAQQAEAAALFSAPAPEDNTPVAKMLDPYKPPQYLGDDDKPLALTPAQKTEYRRKAGVVDPALDLLPEDLVKMARDSEVDLMQVFHSREDEIKQDPKAVARWASAWKQYRDSRGLGDLPNVLELFDSVGQMVWGAAKQTATAGPAAAEWLAAEQLKSDQSSDQSVFDRLPVSPGVSFGLVKRLLGGKETSTPIQTELERQMVEAGSSSQAGLQGFVEQMRRLANLPTTLAQEMAKSKLLPEAVKQEIAAGLPEETQQQSIDRLFLDSEKLKIARDTLEGKGPLYSTGVAEDLAARGAPVRPEEAQEMAAGDVASLVANLYTFKGLGAVIPEVFTQAELAAGGKVLAEKTAQAAGAVSGATAKVLSKVEKVLPAAGAVKGALLGGVPGVGIGYTAGVGGAKLAASVAEKAAKVAAMAPEVAGTAIPNSAYAQMAKSFLQSLPQAAYATGQGLMFDAANAASAETPEEVKGVGIGALFGMLGAGKAMGIPMLSGLIAGERGWKNIPVPLSRNLFPFLDPLHEANTAAATPLVQNRVAVNVNAAQQVVPTGDALFVGPRPLDAIRARASEILKGPDQPAEVSPFEPQDPNVPPVIAPRPTWEQAMQQASLELDPFAKGLVQEGMSPENAYFYSRANGARAKLPDGRSLIYFRDPASAPHEIAGHGTEALLGESVMRAFDRQIQSDPAYANNWDKIASRYAHDLGWSGPGSGESWQDFLLRASGWGYLEASEKLVRQQLGEGPYSPEQARAAWQEIQAKNEGRVSWKDILTPDEQANVVNRYVSREIYAENEAKAFNHKGGFADTDHSIPASIARVTAGLMDYLGYDPVSGERSPEQQWPLNFDLMRTAPKLVTQKLAGKPVEAPAPKKPKISFGIPGTPQQKQDAVEEAKRNAEAAPDVPLTPESDSQRKILGIFAEGIATGGVVRVTRHEAPGEIAAALGQTGEGRKSQVEAGRTMSQAERPLRSQLVTPVRVVAIGHGDFQILNWNRGVFDNSAIAIASALAEGKLTTDPRFAALFGPSAPFEIDPNTKTFTTEGWQKLNEAVTKFVKNQSGGRTGSGVPIVVPRFAAAEGYFAPSLGAGEGLPQKQADFISLLFGFKLPDTPRITKGKLPLSVAAEGVSEATIPGRLSEPTLVRAKPGKPAHVREPFEGPKAEKLAIEGHEIQEVNPLRKQLEEALGDNMPSISSALQRLNLKDIKAVEHAPEQPQFRGETLALSAGFQPAAEGTQFQAPREEQKNKALDLGSREEAQFQPAKEEEEAGPVYYSQLARTVDEKFSGKQMPAAQLAAILRNPQNGVKADEMKWTGMDDFLQGKQKVTKAEVQDFLRENAVTVKEVTKGGVRQPEAKDIADLKEGLRAMDRENYYRDPQEEAAPVPDLEKIQNVRATINAAVAEGDWGMARNRLTKLATLWEDAGYDYSTPDKLSELAGKMEDVVDVTREKAPEFERYQLPGGENYRELLFTLPEMKSPEHAAWKAYVDELTAKYGEDFYNSGSLTEPEKIKLKGLHLGAAFGSGAVFKSGHWDEPNVLAHARLNERTDSEGKPGLFCEEIQSDWHQKGRKKGYKTAATEEISRLVKEREALEKEAEPWTSREEDAPPELIGRHAVLGDRIDALRRQESAGAPDAPFKNTWQELVFRRLVRMAAERGKDWLGWTTGEQQAERYDLSKQLSKVTIAEEAGTPGRFTVMGADHGGATVIHESGIRQEKLSDYIGKELADRALSDMEKETVSQVDYSGLDLKVGGEGMKGFYDKMLVDYANKFGKKFGARVEERSISGEHDASGNKPFEDRTNAVRILDGGGEVYATFKGHNEERVKDYNHLLELEQEHGGSFAESYVMGDRQPANTIHSLPITPEMKSSVMREGVAQFQPATKTGRDLEKEGYRFSTTDFGAGTFDIKVKSATGEDAGYITITQADPKTADVSMVSVRPEYQDQNLGEALYREAAAKLQQDGVTLLRGNVVHPAPYKIREKLFGPPVSIEEAGATAKGEVAHTVESAIRPEAQFQPKTYIVRHGSTELNKEDTSKDRIRGFLDVPLSDKGKKEAATLAKGLAGSGITTVLTSDLKRARQTADAIAKETGADVVEDPGLRPWHFGPTIEGKPTDEMLPVIEDLVEHPNKVPPGGESFNSFRDRFLGTFHDAQDTYAKENLALVTHYRGTKLLEAWRAEGTDNDRVSREVFEAFDKDKKPASYDVLDKAGAEIEGQFQGSKLNLPEKPDDFAFAKGWLSPRGDFYRLKTNEAHEIWARKVTGEYPVPGSDAGPNTPTGLRASQILYDNGWLRTTPYGGDSLMTNSERGRMPTDAQKEVLSAAARDLGIDKIYHDNGNSYGLIDTNAQFQGKQEDPAQEKANDRTFTNDRYSTHGWWLTPAGALLPLRTGEHATDAFRHLGITPSKDAKNDAYHEQSIAAYHRLVNKGWRAVLPKTFYRGVQDFPSLIFRGGEISDKAPSNLNPSQRAAMELMAIKHGLTLMNNLGDTLYAPPAPAEETAPPPGIESSTPRLTAEQMRVEREARWEAQGYKRDPKTGNFTSGQYQPPFQDKGFDKELAEIRAGRSGGATFNADGTLWQSANRDEHLASLFSVNLPLGKLNRQNVEDAIRQHFPLLDEPNIKPGIFAFSKDGVPTVSVDLNAVVPNKFLENTKRFATQNDQVSIWDTSQGEYGAEIPTGGKGNTRLKTTGELLDALASLTRGEPADVNEIIKENTVEGVPQKEENLPGTTTRRKLLPSATLGKMSNAEIAEYYPESVKPRTLPRNAKGEKVHEGIPSNIAESPLAKAAGGGDAAEKAFGRKLVEFAKEWLDHPSFQSGLKWYSEFVPMLKKEFGKYHPIMAELLAGTSPNEKPENNYAMALEALEAYKAGQFDKQIAKYHEGLDKFKDGSWKQWIAREVKAGKVKKAPETPTEETFLNHWVDKYALKPRKANGKLFGISSDAVLKIFARTWLEQTPGLKTQNFVKNLLGIGHEATIDVWADRTMRRIGYSGFRTRWRILPKNGVGVSDADFKFSQAAFKHAAKEMGMLPDALQGGLWFAEKQLWADNGWGKLDLGDYRSEIAKTERLKQGIQQIAASKKAAGRAREAEQPELLIGPRKLKE